MVTVVLNTAGKPESTKALYEFTVEVKWKFTWCKSILNNGNNAFHCKSQWRSIKIL